MPLFTTPLSVTWDAAARVFSFRGQLPDAKSVVGEYVVPGGSAIEDNKITAKHLTSGSVERHLLQFKGNYETSVADVYEPITVNFTITHHADHADAAIVAAVAIMASLLAEADFAENFAIGMI